jgi:TRAP-type C4-dicarboxylate transport system permease small subunit
MWFHIKRLLNAIKYLFVLACGLVLLGVTPFIANENWQRYQAQDWPKMMAVISQADVMYFEQGGGRLELRYIYTVDGQLHVRHVEERVSKKSGVSGVKARWDYYAIGKPIPIAYHPTQPNISWAQNEIIASFWIVLALPLILGIGTLLVLWVAVSGLKEQYATKKN